MSTVTLSDVNVAVNKAFAAGIAGEAYEGLMPSAHDAGVHWAQSYGTDLSGSFPQAYQAALLNAATIGFKQGQTGMSSSINSGYQLLPADLSVGDLVRQDLLSVFQEGWQAGNASNPATTNPGTPEWVPWAIGGGVVVVAVGAVAISQSRSNPTRSNPTGRRIKLQDLGIHVHPRSEWPRAGLSYGTQDVEIAPDAELHTTQTVVDEDLLLKREEELKTGEKTFAEVFRLKNGQWWILDGHHTLAAARRLGMPVRAGRHTGGPYVVDAPKFVPPRRKR